MTEAQSYQFAAEPRAVVPRKKFREPEPTDGFPTNIMFDKRVVRGNTYATHVLPATAQQDALQMQEESEKRKRQEWKSRQKTMQMKAPQTPDAVDGRKHIDIQTETYLEELTDRLVEADMDTQTDAFLDRPPSPLFVPKKSGVDSETQIYPDDLFNFDFEVEPILEVLVGKTLEQSMMEVMEEDELANLRAHQEEFIQMRAAELAEAQRMEEAERRRSEEKERRRTQERERLQKEEKVSDKVAARAYAKNYVSDLFSSVFSNLQREGFFYDPLMREIEEEFVPWLMSAVGQNITHIAATRQVADSLMAGVAGQAQAQHQAVLDGLYAKEQERLRLLAEAEAERQRLEEEERQRREAEEEAERRRLEEEAALEAEAAVDEE